MDLEVRIIELADGLGLGAVRLYRSGFNGTLPSSHLSKNLRT